MFETALRGAAVQRTLYLIYTSSILQKLQDDTKPLFEACTTECQVDEDCGSNEKCCDYILGECQQNVCLKAI